MKKAEDYKKRYEELKAWLMGDLWFIIKERPGQMVDITETPGIPALVTGNFDDQESETIDEIIVRDNKVIAIASSYYAPEQEYNLEEWEVPFLVAILESVEKHIELEDQEK